MPGTGGEAASYGDLLITSLIVLGGVCVAAFLAVRFLGRLLATGRSRGAHLLDVVARVPLEPRRSLYVVDVAGKTLLVGTSEMGLSVLSELDRSEVQSRIVEQPTFAELVRNAWLKRRKPAAAELAAAGPPAAEARSVEPRSGEELSSEQPSAEARSAELPVAQPAAVEPAAAQKPPESGA